MKLWLGNCLSVLKTLDDNSIHAVVTDPPYGLAFMNKKWDYDVPSVEIWREVLRVLRPGGHLLSFGGTRTYHRMVVNIEDAGFEIRDQIQWIYGSGFPKSLNIKEGDFKGWGTALKPANEPIVLARKPIEGTVAENIEKWGVGGLNVDASRIEGKKPEMIRTSTVVAPNAMQGKSTGATSTGKMLNEGRWPANVIFDEEAAEMLDGQSGWTSGKANFKITPNNGGWAQKSKIKNQFSFGDSGGASRFFYCAKASKRERNAGLEGMPLHEGVRHLDGGPWTENKTAKSGEQKRLPTANHHPTVKPIKLMEYLCKLVTPLKGIILDPFMGSGSTGIAAKNLGFDFIGMEYEKEYWEIAQKRING